MQGSETQFMVAFTRETPTDIDTEGIKRKAQERLNQLTSGRRMILHSEAVQQVMKEMAGELKLVYYEGKNGTFTRMVPPAPRP